MRRVATHRAVLRSAWLGAQHKMSRGGAVQLSPREEAGRLLERWGDAFIAQTFAAGDTWRATRSPARPPTFIAFTASARSTSAEALAGRLIGVSFSLLRRSR